MKKIIFIFFFYLQISIIPLNAGTLSALEEFAHNISETVFNIAWPTANYRDVEVVDFYDYPTKTIVYIKFIGESSMCFISRCPLSFELKITLDKEYSIKSMSVIEHNAILSPPFKTVGDIAYAMSQANNK